MADESTKPDPEEPEEPEEWKRPGGPTDYDENGGTGLEGRPADDVIDGGVAGRSDDPVGESATPDEVESDTEAQH